MVSTRNVEATLDGYGFEFYDRGERNGRGTVVVSLKGGQQMGESNPTRGEGHLHESIDTVEGFMGRMSAYSWDDRLKHDNAFLHFRGAWTLGRSDHEAFIRALNRVFDRPEITVGVTLHGENPQTDNDRTPEPETDDVIDEYIGTINTRFVDENLEGVWDDVDETRQWYARQARRGNARFVFGMGDDMPDKDRIEECRSRYRIPPNAIGVVPLNPTGPDDKSREYAVAAARNHGYRFFEARKTQVEDGDGNEAG